jgi:hypothetical protein
MGYNFIMCKVYVSNRVNLLFKYHLEQLGCQIETLLDSPYLSCGIASHPDLFMCKMGCHSDSPIFFGNPCTPKTPYPADVPYNAACTGKHFIHFLPATDSALLQMAQDMNLELINVRQGYTKCNTVVVDENSLITSDKGIFFTLKELTDIDCLLIQPGYINLPGYETGFIGGASGKVGNRILFHGNLRDHPDSLKIIKFIEAKDLDVVWFEEFPLTDIGSIIEASRWET